MTTDDPDRDALLDEWEAAGYPWRSPALPEIPPAAEVPMPSWGAWPAAAGMPLGLVVAAMAILALAG